MDQLGGAADLCGDISHKMLRNIAARTPVKCPQGEFRIFDSLSPSVDAPFEIESFLYFREGAPFIDPPARALRFRRSRRPCCVQTGAGCLFYTIPAMSEKSYSFDTKDSSTIGKFENVFYEAADQVALGKCRLTSPGQVTDTTTGEGFFKSPLALSVTADSSDTWSHGIHGYGSRTHGPPAWTSSVCRGALASFLFVKQGFGQLSAELKYAIYRDLPFVDLFVKVHWKEKRSVLKLEIEPLSSFDTFEVQGPGAAITKNTNGIEEPLHGWIKASDLAILQDGAFAMDRLDSKIRITLVRSSLYGYDKSWTIDELGPHATQTRASTSSGSGSSGTDLIARSRSMLC